MRRFLWIGLAFVLLAGLGMPWLYAKRRARSEVDVASVEKDIRQHLPLGTSRREVGAYLDQKGIPHSYIDESKEFSEYQHTEMALIRETSRTWLIRVDLQVLLKFDNQDRLIDYKFQEIGTGP